MANEVYANSMEVSCKAANGKSICAFPDVCFTPPQTPATPPGVPIPYPNTGMATDCTSGSTSVKISGQEVMLKNKSYFKRSTGDEAGCAPKKGVLTSTNMGKVYFNAWSMDVKIEGENVVRNLDITTHNHASLPGNSPPWPYVDAVSPGVIGPCARDREKEESACGYDHQTGTYSLTPAQACADRDCQAARKCMLVPYESGGTSNCCPGLTPHHMIEDHWVTGNANFPMAQGTAGYNAAPCVCASGSRFDGQHGIMHGIQGVYEDSFVPGSGSRPAGINARAGRTWTYATGRKAAVRAHGLTFDRAGNKECEPKCLEAQLDHFYGPDTSPSRQLNQPQQRQAISQESTEQKLNRAEAEALVDSVFGGASL